MLNKGKQRTYALIMDSGDKVLENLRSFAIEHYLHASHFNAIGAFANVTGVFRF